jgi:hypothetical protein
MSAALNAPLLVEDGGASESGRPAGEWQPHGSSACEFPVLAQAVDRFSLQKLCRDFYRIRWTVVYPFQRRVTLSPKHWCTVGELLVLPVVILLIFQPVWGFLHPKQPKPGKHGEMPNPLDTVEDLTKGSGSAPTVALIVSLSTACHNSIWTFLLGTGFLSLCCC